MHGRVKTRTTEEQREIIRQAKIKKAETFKNAMLLVFSKRSSGSHDQEALNLSAELLAGNPDIITLWNYRREIFLEIKKVENLDNYQKILEKDLLLTEQCLKVNPKSYGSWHHRIWVMDNLPRPNWNKELNICTKYLKLDERNFHCWDYRRIVTDRSNIPVESEYRFTLEKIKTNFSNYSAWHLRSKLLPVIYPDPDNKFPINEAKHKQELELVENAAFTDPSDQSAWFYQRWLLGLKEPKPSLVYIKVKNEILVVTSKTVSVSNNLQQALKIVIKINSKLAAGNWESCCSNPSLSCIWKFKPNFKIQPTDSITVQLQENQVECDSQQLQLQMKSSVETQISFAPKFCHNIMETIQEQLSSCHQLLQLEPDSKWTMLTSIYLMLSINGLIYKKQIKDSLERLTEIDPQRRGHYMDLRSKIVMQLAIMESQGMTSFGLINETLTSLHHSQYLYHFEEVDLSFNLLSSNSLPQLYVLLNCKKLNLSNNRIKYLTGFPILPRLEYLLLDYNLVEKIDEEPFKRNPQLIEVSLKANPISLQSQVIQQFTNGSSILKFNDN